MSNLINYLGVALSLLGLAAVAPDAVRRVLTMVRNKTGWPKRPRPSLIIYSVEGWGHPRLTAPDPSLTGEERVTALHAMVDELYKYEIEIDQRLDGRINTVANEMSRAFAEVEADSRRLNAAGFIPVGFGILCSGIAEELAAWGPLAWATVLVSSGAIVWSAVWIWRWIAADRRRV